MSTALIVFLAATGILIATAARSQQIQIIVKGLLKDHNELIAQHHVASDAVVNLLATARRLELRHRAYDFWAAISLLTAIISIIVVFVQAIR